MVEPGGILGEIVARKREDVGARLAGVSIGELRSRAAPTTRSLAAALARAGGRFIMEVKRASPSEGRLRADADPAALARAYAPAADAISVLVDAPYFGGSYEDLAAVRAAFDGPILAKDFVIDPRQVPEARAHGADAILVMLSVLSDAQARDVMAEAERLNMDVLVEAHDEREVRRAVALGSAIIGINNRDLRTLRVDLATTERLSHLVPPDRLLVTESGIASRADVQRLAPHADAFLVGSSLMKAPSPAKAARTLAFGRVKVCGLTRAADVTGAIGAGATHAGLIFVAGTPRAITADAAQPLAEAARKAGARPVGIFRNERLLEVARTALDLDLAAVQLHGEEDRQYIHGLRNLLPEEVEIWAACGVGGAMPERIGADRLLFDTAADKGRSGGTGRVFDWNRVAHRADLPRSLVAGGLNPANARAAARLGAWALDVGSGVEAAPGRKDPARLAAFFEALRPISRMELACA
jgi:indole-3-glycerol phosphate synthase / phosphoribosylanthranilate isomerase